MAPEGESAPANPLVVLPGLRVAKVTCTAGHLLPGLFVIFRKHEESWLKKLKESVGPLDPAFQLGVVGDSGYLAPAVPPLTNQAAALPGAQADLIPDSHRLAPGHPYQVYLIHHPSYALARETLDRINAGRERTEPKILTTTAESVLQVPEEAASFFPPGPQFYGGWFLFRSMPGAACPPCAREVGRLQAHLGALRYAIGSSNFPYLPDFGEDADKSGGANDGLFDVRVMNAVASFQTDVLAGTPPFALAPPNPHGGLAEPSHPAPDPDLLRRRRGPGADVESSWSYLKGTPAGAPAASGITAADGVVDTVTADALRAWLRAGYRKPGAILVQIEDPRGWARMWLRPEAARSWYLWNELTKALGFSAGVCVNHTFRSAQVDIGHAGYGRSARSIHKTGLAMDLGLTSDFKRSVPQWPVAYSRELDGDRIWWRLWATAQLPGPGSATEAAVAAELAAKLSSLKARLASHDLFATDPERLLDRVDTLISALREDPAGFFVRYTAAEVEVWDYDPYHPEGGVPVGRSKAPDFYRSHQRSARQAKLASAQAAATAAKTPAAKVAAERKVAQAQAELDELNAPGAPLPARYLDLTRLAELVGLSRIHAFRKGWQQVVQTMKVAALAKIAVMLKEARTSPKWAAAGDPVIVRRKGGVINMKVQDLDDEFMLAWDRGANALKKNARSVKMVTPQLTVSLTWGKGKLLEDAAKAASHLRQFGDKLFHAVDPFTGQPAVRNGTAWADLIDTAPAELEKVALVKQNEAEAAAQAKGKKVPSRAPAPERRLLTLQPVFLRTFTPPATGDTLAAIPFLPGDVADLPAPGQPIGMEWWHYQRSDLLGSGKSRSMWGRLLMELGWTREGLLDEAAPVLHYRRGVGYPAAELEKLAF